MRKIIFTLCFCLPFIAFCQEKLLTKKIVYDMDLKESVVKSDLKKDSVVYTYKVNQRFWWEAMDLVLDAWKSKKLNVRDEKGNALQWDSVQKSLEKKITEVYKKKPNKKEMQRILENNITKIRFEEEWTYDVETMLIKKKILAYCPIISLDTVVLVDDDLQAKERFAFPLGWIRDAKAERNESNLLITRNIHYTMPIYNYVPYRWWDNNLEEEYSLPFFDRMIERVLSLKTEAFETPDMTEAMQKKELQKRLMFTKNETVIESSADGTEKEYEVVLNIDYTGADFDYLRFGEEIYFDVKNFGFIKNTNYIAPVIGKKAVGESQTLYYPVFYLRKK
ncbi:MAG: hypothetical protein IJ748_06240 [Bacteroidales bacterium]|nr:hypothetical protein [Bacteroidales bacterium]